MVEVERINFKREMSEDEWIALCCKAYPFGQRFRSTGKGGWINLLSMENFPVFSPLPDERWWTESIPYQGPLHDPYGMRVSCVGTYNSVNGKGVGEIFYKVKGVEL